MDEKDAPSEDTPVLKGSDIKLDSISDSQESLRNDNLHDMEPLSYLNLILLNITWFGTNLMYLVLCVVVVPAQIHAMVGEAAKGRWLGGIVAAGALLVLILGPMIGMLSDRMVTRFGRRRPIMVVATLVLCLGLFGMALSSPEIQFDESMNDTSCEPIDLVEKRCSPYSNQTYPVVSLEAPKIENADQSAASGLVSDPEVSLATTFGEVKTGNIGLYIIFYLMSMSSLVALHVPYNGLMADKAPPQQRGSTSGMMGFMILLGNISGAVIGIFFGTIGVLGIYIFVSSVLVVTVLITVITTTEELGKTTHEPLNFRTMVCDYIEPFRQRDFCWVFFTRFLMQQGIATVTGFLEYWIGDMIPLPNCMAAHTAIGLILVPLLFTAALCSIAAGCFSDKYEKRKPIVMGAALIMSVVAVLFAAIRGPNSFYGVIVISLLFGIGYGSFVAVDFALVLDVLPAEKDKAKDIAIWSVAFVLPQLIATPTGGILLDVFEYVNCEIGLGYIILFSVTSVYFMLSALFVSRIKGVE